MQKVAVVLLFSLVTLPALAAERRGTKLSIGAGTQNSVTTFDTKANRPSNAGAPFFQTLYSAISDYVTERGGDPAWRGFAVSTTQNRGNLYVWLPEPDGGVDLARFPFRSGEHIPLYSGRTIAQRNNETPISLDLRVPFSESSGKHSRWSWGFHGTRGNRSTVQTDSFIDQLTTGDVRLSSSTALIGNRRTLVADIGLQRSMTLESYSISRRASVITTGPELNILSSRFVDVSLEAGIGATIYYENTHLNTSVAPSRALAPELATPPRPNQTSDPAPSSKKDRTYSQGHFQMYGGARLELYPLRSVGVGVNTRRYAYDAPEHIVYNNSALGPIPVTIRSKLWTTSFYIVWTK